MGEERVEQAREEVEGGRRDPERERVVVQARGRQRQRQVRRRRRMWRLLLRGRGRCRLLRCRVGVGVGVGRFGVRGGAGLVAAQALARAGGGAEEDEERGGRLGGEEELGRGRHGAERPGRMLLLVLVVVREWLSRRRCEIREDLLAIAVTRHRSVPLACTVASGTGRDPLFFWALGRFEFEYCWACRNPSRVLFACSESEPRPTFPAASDRLREAPDWGAAAGAIYSRGVPPVTLSLPKSQHRTSETTAHRRRLRLVPFVAAAGALKVEASSL